MDWKHWADVGTAVGGFSAALALLVGVISAVLVLVQMYASARSARAISALETHRDYLQLCIDRPELSSSDAMRKHLKRERFDGILDQPLAIETERALWFLSYVLNTAEQILETTSFLWFRDEYWETTIAAQLGYHDDLIRAVWPTWRPHYGARLARHIDALLASPDLLLSTTGRQTPKPASAMRTAER